MVVKKKLLLHVCCAPCSTHCVELLKQDYDIVMYYYNPNIHPYGEYARRFEDEKKVAKASGVELKEGDFDVHNWLENISGLEDEPEGGKRCEQCFSMRLNETARYAAENGFDIFTTTMTISPHKNADLINKLGLEAAEKHSIKWLHSDFKKRDGFRKSVEMSRKLGLYRQDYCGCFYSIRPNFKDTDKKELKIRNF